MEHIGNEGWRNATISIIYLIISLFCPNVVVYFGWSAIYVVCLFLVNKSWEKVVIYGYWPIQVYYVGQLYVFQVIKPEALNHPLYPDGKSLFFKFTPYMAMGIAILVTWIIKISQERMRSSYALIILWLILGANVISTIGQINTIPSWVRLLDTVGVGGYLTWWWWTYNYYLKLKESGRINFWKYWRAILTVIIVLGSLIVIFQGIVGGMLGLTVEQTPILPYFGNGSDEETWFVRPIGYLGNANGMAHLLLLQMVSLFFVYMRLKENTGILKKWMVLPLLALFWMQSRTVLIGMGIICLWWWFIEGKKIEWSKVRIKSRWVGVGVIFMMLVGISILSARFINTIQNTGKYSGFDTRSNLTEVARNLINQNLWWGVGVNNFIPSAFHFDMTGVFKLFPEPVHNGFLLIATEQGLIGFVLWSIFVVYLLVIVRNRLSSQIGLLFYFFIVSEMVMMIFQPFTDLTSLPVVFVVLLLADVKSKKI